MATITEVVFQKGATTKICIGTTGGIRISEASRRTTPTTIIVIILSTTITIPTPSGTIASVGTGAGGAATDGIGELAVIYSLSGTVTRAARGLFGVGVVRDLSLVLMCNESRNYEPIASSPKNS